MIHELNIDSPTFERIGREELRAVITHVLPGTRLPELADDHVLLSIHVQEAP